MGVVAIAFLAVPLFANEYLYTEVLIPVLILARRDRPQHPDRLLRAVSLGTGGFMAVGAYAAYNLALRCPGKHHPGVPVRGLMATLVGILFGLPSPSHQGLRSRGGDARGAVLPRMGVPPGEVGHPLRAIRLGRGRSAGPVRGCDQDARKALSAHPRDRRGAALAAKNLVRERIGRMWMAMRDMDIAAEIIGIRPLHAKLSAFAVSSFYIGIAGALWGFFRLGSVGAGGVRHQPVVPGPVHDHHRRARNDPGLVPRRRLHHADRRSSSTSSELAGYRAIDLRRSSTSSSCCSAP